MLDTRRNPVRPPFMFSQKQECDPPSANRSTLFQVFQYDPYDDSYQAVPLNSYHTVYITPGAGPGTPPSMQNSTQAMEKYFMEAMQTFETQKSKKSITGDEQQCANISTAMVGLRKRRKRVSGVFRLGLNINKCLRTIPKLMEPKKKKKKNGGSSFLMNPGVHQLCIKVSKFR